VLGLFYHVVSDERLPHVENLYPYKTPAIFEHDLVYLKQHFVLLSETDFQVARKHELPPRPTSIAVTFDDGFSERDGGLARKEDFIVNRLWADRPSANGSGSDLERTIRRGYADYLVSLVP